RHARWFLKWLEEGRDSTETGMGLWFDQVEAEQDNIRAALAWAMATSDGGTDELTLRLVGVLGPFWGARGHLSEGRRWTEAALTSRCPGESSDLRVRVGEILAGLAQAQGDHRQAGESLGEGLAHWRSRKDEVGVARCLAGLGLLARYRGDLAEADRLLSEALGCLGGAEGAADLGACLAQMGQLAAVRGQEARAAALYEEALAKLSVDGDAIGTADVLNQMGKLSVVRGEASMARSRCEEALAIHRENGHLPGVATSLELLGDVARMTDEFDLSATLNREALAIDRGLGDQRGIAKSLASLAQLAYQTGRHDQAGRLYQEVLELRRRLGDRRGEATALVGMANALLLDENRPPDLERARSLCEEALAIHRDVGDRRGAAWCLFSLAEICRDLEDYPAAKLAAEESLEIHRQLGDSALTTLALCSLGHLAHRRSDFETARDLAADATRMALALGKSLQIVRCVELVARVHCALGQAELSARLYGAAEAGRLSLGLAPPRPPERAILQGDLAALRSSLGLAATNEAMQAGRHLSILEGAALALSDERYQSVGANGKGPREVSGRPTWSLRLLGGVALYARGVPVEVGGKMPPKLFKVVALLGPLQVDEAVELLWPDAPPGMGRRRLHNVISRLNATCGAVIVRQGESLGLSSEVEVDARNFEQLAKAALVGGRGGRPQADVCRQALSLYHGELLPSDRYEDWTAWPRVRLAGLHLELLDALAVAAGNAGRLDEAVEWLEQAIQAEPLDDDRYRRAARLMVQQGWHNRARSLALRARRISEELGVPLSGELVDLLSDVAP
ncbi:MAG: tetratricopeptide repeat protein, partial [Acidimicrobiales bacterium]